MAERASTIERKRPKKRPTPPLGSSGPVLVTGADEPAPVILIVDDNRDSRELYTDFLRYAGYQTLEARSGEEALAMARMHSPDLVLMDLAMPHMTGWEAAREMRRDMTTRQIKIIALTGHALSSSAELALEAGCDIFLTKPCPPEILEHEVKKLLERDD